MNKVFCFVIILEHDFAKTLKKIHANITLQLMVSNCKLNISFPSTSSSSSKGYVYGFDQGFWTDRWFWPCIWHWHSLNQIVNVRHSMKPCHLSNGIIIIYHFAFLVGIIVTGWNCCRTKARTCNAKKKNNFIQKRTREKSRN